jgi:hypothetical protein
MKRCKHDWNCIAGEDGLGWFYEIHWCEKCGAVKFVDSNTKKPMYRHPKTAKKLFGMKG